MNIVALAVDTSACSVHARPPGLSGIGVAYKPAEILHRYRAQFFPSLAPGLVQC